MGGRRENSVFGVFPGLPKSRRWQSRDNAQNGPCHQPVEDVRQLAYQSRRGWLSVRRDRSTPSFEYLMATLPKLARSQPWQTNSWRYLATSPNPRNFSHRLSNTNAASLRGLPPRHGSLFGPRIQLTPLGRDRPAEDQLHPVLRFGITPSRSDEEESSRNRPALRRVIATSYR
jgi:hypothetical protein